MNNIIRIITQSSKYYSLNSLYKQLKLLQFEEVYKLDLVKFMHMLYHGNLPVLFKNYFTHLTSIHKHNTRHANNSNYFLPCVTKKFSQVLLS